MLRTLILTLNDYTRWKVGDTNRGFSLVDVLTARTGSPIGINFEVRRIDIEFDLLNFRENGNRTGRCMDSSLCFGVWNPLHAMCTGFKFELRINVSTAHPHNDFLVSTQFALAFAHNFGLPAFFFGVAKIHSIEVRRE